MKNLADQLLRLDPDKLKKLLSTLTGEQAQAVMDDWELWAQPYQRLPEGNWRRWIMRAGRACGKTWSAAKTTNEVAKDRKKIRTGEIGIIARTWSDARNTCVEGPSGILVTAPSYFRPEWHPGNGLLVWPNGVRGRIYSADRPEQMRGPNFSWVWADEICHWPDPKKVWWEAVEPALRIGWARAMITTTPLPDPFLKKLEEKDDTVVTRASTYDNRFLTEGAKEALRANYEGTRIGRQELYGEILDANAGAMWRYETIENFRLSWTPDLRRIVVAVDPAVSVSEESDETGIIVYGVDDNNHGYVLHDASGKYSPTEWGEIVVSLYTKYSADRVIAEINQGGDMVESTLRAVDSRVSYQSVRATRGKVLRAEPVSALYERGMVHHVGEFVELEKQLTTWVPGMKSPDRLDALVYAATHCQLTGEKAKLPPSAYL